MKQRQSPGERLKAGQKQELKKKPRQYPSPRYGGFGFSGGIDFPEPGDDFVEEESLQTPEDDDATTLEDESFAESEREEQQKDATFHPGEGSTTTSPIWLWTGKALIWSAGEYVSRFADMEKLRGRLEKAVLEIHDNFGEGFQGMGPEIFEGAFAKEWLAFGENGEKSGRSLFEVLERHSFLDVRRVGEPFVLSRLVLNQGQAKSPPKGLLEKWLLYFCKLKGLSPAGPGEKILPWSRLKDWLPGEAESFTERLGIIIQRLFELESQPYSKYSPSTIERKILPDMRKELGRL